MKTDSLSWSRGTEYLIVMQSDTLITRSDITRTRLQHIFGPRFSTLKTSRLGEFAPDALPIVPLEVEALELLQYVDKSIRRCQKFAIKIR